MGSVRKVSFPTVLVCLLFLAGCDSEQSGDLVATISDTELTLPVPERIRSINALDPNNITATAIVNGVPATLQRNSAGGFRGAIQVPAQSTFSVDVEFSEQFANEKLVLATSSQQVTTGSGNQQLNLRRSSYDFASHDADADSVSNIVEREEDTDPLDSAQAPQMINVTVIARQPQALQSGSFGNYFFEANVGSDVKVLSASGSDFRGSFYVVDRAPVEASVQMVETFTGQQLTVATQTRQLNAIADQQTVIFEANVYSMPDRDGDGQSDVAELVAGTDLNTPDNPTTPTSTLTARFTVPEVIQNAQSIYAEYRIDNQLISLSRSENSFSATTNTSADSIVVLDITLLDNFNNTPYVLGTAQKTVSINNAPQTVSFTDGDFLLSQDNDSDGTANYLERQAGTDPFNPPVVVPPTDPVSCTVSALPVTTGLPGAQVTLENVSSYIDCGGASYSINASGFSFTWSQVADNLGWFIPADSVGGGSFDYQIEVANPSISTDIYATAVVSTEVEETQCTETTRQVQFETSADLFLQNNRIFNNEELRVNAANRRALIGFDVPAQEGQLTAAALVVTVGEDSGDGVIGVYQDDSFQWSESDFSLEFPVLTNLVGSRDGEWETDATYTIGLTSLFISGPQVNLFLQQGSGGNDVAFTSRETAFPSVLVLEYTGCF